MAFYDVTCHVPDNADIDRRIQGIGGLLWYKTVDEVISCINNGDVFRVAAYGRVVQVIVRQHQTSRRYYITTEGDGYPPNNLLRLPRCRGR